MCGKLAKTHARKLAWELCIHTQQQRGHPTAVSRHCHPQRQRNTRMNRYRSIRAATRFSALGAYHGLHLATLAASVA